MREVFMVLILTLLSIIVTALYSIERNTKSIICTSKNKHQLVTVTMFYPESGGINSDKNPTKTAFMKKPISGYTVAVSDELLYDGWIGKVYIDGLGVYEITCRMRDTVKGKCLDICAPSKEYADKFGVRYNVFAILLN